jgi:Tfp pilus assembly protein PilF
MKSPTLLLFSLAMTLVFACSDRREQERARVASGPAQTAEAALEQRAFSRAIAAAELAASYDPLDPKLRDLVLRARLTAAAEGAAGLHPERNRELDFHAEVMIARDPPRAHVYKTARGYLAFGRNDLAAAEAHFRDGIKDKAEFAPSHVGLGVVFLQTGKRDEARTSFNDALSHDADYRPALAQLGALLLDKSENEKAVEILTKALAKGDSADVRLSLASAYAAMQKIGEAGEQLQKAVALEPNNAEAQRRVGDFFAAIGQLEAAERAFANASRLGAEPGATFGLGIVQLKKGNPGDAARLFDGVLRLAPQMPLALYNAGLAHEGAGNSAEAARRFEAYLSVAKAEPKETTRLADASARLERLKGSSAAADDKGKPAKGREKTAQP